MKWLLILSILLCLISVLRSSIRRAYPVIAVYLTLCLATTAMFQIESEWLLKWYVPSALIVCILRVAAATEIAYRQAERFQGRFWLLITSFWVGVLFAAGCWYVTSGGSTLIKFVELRRIAQIFMASGMLFIEGFWLTQGGGAYRRQDWIGIIFTGLLANHAFVSLLSLGIGWNMPSWQAAASWSWLVDTAAYAMLATLFLPYPIVHRLILIWTRFRCALGTDPCWPASSGLSR